MVETEKAITIILSKKGHKDAIELAARARLLMNNAFNDATVTDYHNHSDGIKHLPDEGDRHVIAAAIKASANCIVTENLRDFPRKKLGKYGIETKSSDEFIAHLSDQYPSLALEAFKRMQRRLNRPDKTHDVLLLDMHKTGLTLAAKQIRTLLE